MVAIDTNTEGLQPTLMARTMNATIRSLQATFSLNLYWPVSNQLPDVVCDEWPVSNF